MEDVNASRVGRVLTYPRRLLDVGSNRGRLVWCRAGPASRRIESAWRWTERRAAETSLDLVQPIPCAVIVDGVGRCCVLERPEAKSEIGKLSLIVGGHVDEEDARDSLDATLIACLERELAEEVDLPEEPAPRSLGVAVDARSTALSRHLGYIYVKDAERVAPKTCGKDQGSSTCQGRRSPASLPRGRGWTETSCGLTPGRPSSSGCGSGYWAGRPAER